MVGTTLYYRHVVSVGLSSNAINLSSSDIMGHRIQIPMTITDLNSFFLWRRDVGNSRPVGRFNPAGAGNGAPTFLVALATSLGIDYDDIDGQISNLDFTSSVLDIADDARLRPGGVTSVNDLVMSYILFKCFGTSSYKTTDCVYNLEDAQNMITNFGVASSIQSSLEESDASGAGSAIDTMFTTLMAINPRRFFDASGRQVYGLFETNTDISESGTWNLVNNDIIEIPVQITFNAPVTLNSIIDNAGEISGNKSKTLVIEQGHSFNIRLQLRASNSIDVDANQGFVINPTFNSFSNSYTSGTIASTWISNIGVNSRGIARNTDTGEVFMLNSTNMGVDSIYQIVFDNAGNISGMVLVAGGGNNSNHVDGVGQQAKLAGTRGIIYAGNNLFYFAEEVYSCIRSFNSSTKYVGTIAGYPALPGAADGTGSAARFSNIIGGITMGSDGNIYVSDSANGCLRCVTPGGVVTTVSGTLGNNPLGSIQATDRGDGTGGAAIYTFYMGGCAGDSAGHIWICDNNALRRFAIATGTVETMSGVPSLLPIVGAPGNDDGLITSASFAFSTMETSLNTSSYYPNPSILPSGGLWMDKVHNYLWIADTMNGSIRLLNLNTYTVSTVVAPSDFITQQVSSITPTSVLVLTNGNVLTNLPMYLPVGGSTPNPTIPCIRFTSPLY